MIKHYLKLSIRNIVRQWFHSIVNILGLGFGIACCILIFIYVQHETGYNMFHKNRDNIYRVTTRFVEETGDVNYTSFQPHSIVEGYKEDIPGVERSSVYRHAWTWVRFGEKNFREIIGFVHPDFLKMFSFPVIEMQSDSILERPQSVVISKDVADKFLCDSIPNYSDLIGQSIRFPQPPPNEYTIEGIIDNCSDISSFRFSILVPFPNCRYYPRSNNSFGSNSVWVQLKNKEILEQTEETANSLNDKYFGENIANLVHFGTLSDSENNFAIRFQPLKDVYLNSSHTNWGYEIMGNRQNTIILSVIALIILTIASINYIMLAIGQSMERLKEMGVMKILGAYKSHIIKHFLSESFLLVILALFLGIVFAEQLLPVFNNLANKDLNFTMYKDWIGLLFLVVILIIIVFSTSSYVTFFLLRHSNPISILKNEISIGKRYRFARTFVILQYFISIVLMVITGIMVRQMNYMLNQPVGFDKENVVVLAVDFPISKTMLLKDKLQQYPLIKNVTTSDRNFVSGSSSDEIRSHKGELISTRILRIDPDYTDALRLELIMGMNFLPNHEDDSVPMVLVNETFVKTFELEEPIGYSFIFNEDFNLEIMGVVRDFHYDSMKDKIQPLIMTVADWNSIWSIFVRIDGQNTAGALEQIKAAWDEVVPEYLIDYSFLDQNLADQYLDQKRWGKITGYSAAAAIFLSCLGLLGLTGMLVAKRSKEISLRKVNGARVRDILFLLNGEFLIWVIFAFILACPVSYLIMNKWMQNFAYRINISWWIFAVTGIIALLIALITVTWRSWRFARRNPIESLRYE